MSQVTVHAGEYREQEKRQSQGQKKNSASGRMRGQFPIAPSRQDQAEVFIPGRS